MVKQEKVRSKNSATVQVHNPVRSRQMYKTMNQNQRHSELPAAEEGEEEMAAHTHTHNILTRQR